jgi:TP901 family phage tail tape measure protein
VAFERIGLGAILSFESTRAIGSMTRAQAAFANLRRSAMHMQTVGMGVSRVFTSMAVAAVPLALAVRSGVRQAIDFEHQMAAVSSILQTNEESMARVTDKAKELGIKTVFSASQVGNAFEQLAKAGFGVEGSIEAIDGVLATAAAGGMEDMGEAATIISDTLRGMGLEFSEATRVADVLSATAMTTNTDIRMLGEGFSYAAPLANTFGLSLEDTSAMLGIFSNAGIKASRSGTAVEAVMRGLIGASRTGRDVFQKLGVEAFDDLTGKMRPVVDVMEDIDNALAREFPAAADRNIATIKLFRMQGMRAFSALRSQGWDTLRMLQEQLGKSGDAMDEAGNRIGAAALAAQKRLDSTEGAVTLLKASIEALNITLVEPALRPVTEWLRRVVDALNNFLFAFQLIADDPSIENVNAMVEEFGQTTVDAVLGVREGIQMLLNAWDRTKANVRDMGVWFGEVFGPVSAQNVAKWTVAISGAMLALGPLGLMMRFVLGIGGALIQILIGAGGLVASLGALVPAAAVVGGVLGAVFLTARNDGEGVGDTLFRVGNELMNFAAVARDFIVTTFEPIGQAMQSVFVENVIPALSQLREFVRMVFTDIFAFSEAITVGSLGLWQNFSTSVGYLVRQIGVVFQETFSGVTRVATAFWQFFTNMVAQLRPAFDGLMAAVTMTINFLGNAFGFLGNVVSLVADAVVDLIQRFSWLGGVASTVINGITSVLRPVLELVYSIGNELFNRVYSVLLSIHSGLQPIFQVLSEIGQVVWSIIGPAFTSLYTTVADLFGVLQDIWNWLAPLKDFVGTVLVKSFQAVFQVVRDILEFVKSIVEGIREIAEFGGLPDVRGQLERQITQQRNMTEQAAADAQRAVEAGREQATRAVVAGVPRPTAARPRPIGMTTTAEVAATAAAAEAGAAGVVPPEQVVDVNVDNTINTQANIDGRCVSGSVSRVQSEARDRAGMTDTPYQRRAAVVSSQIFAEEPVL